MASNKGLNKDGVSATAGAGDELEMLIAQQRELQKKIEEMRLNQREDALHDIKIKIANFEFTAAELGFGGRGRPAKERKQQRAGVAPKYRDPETGATWSGRGKPPKWIAGKDRAEFTI